MGLRDVFGFGSAPSEPVLQGRDVAVIDVGSNSVRLVQYRVEGRALWPVFNEKTMAGLGKGAAESGRLNPEGVQSALRTLKRFNQLLDAKGVRDRMAVATAAVRECEDGPEFVARAFAETGVKIQVLSGADEGRYSSLGVLAGVGEAYGVSGDLGGSSLELSVLNGRRVDEAITLPLGPLALNAAGQDPKRLRDQVETRLQTVSDLLGRSGQTFYAVGGAWRAFANLSMAMKDYPLRLLHEYELSARDVYEVAAFAMKQSESSLASVRDVSSKRAATLPYAALLLDEIVRSGGFDRVIFSANGLREGVVCVADPSLVEEGDPLVSGAEALAHATSPEPGFGVALADWIAPVMAAEPSVFGTERDARVRAAAARMSDIGARLHPDHRADLAFTQVLYAPIGGQSHAERAFLALALHHRYEGKKGRGPDCPAVRLLAPEHREAAMRLGLALRFGAALSGRTASLLDKFELQRSESVLRIVPGPGAEALIVERAHRRFEQFATALGLKTELSK